MILAKFDNMANLIELEKAVRGLSDTELDDFRRWFEAFDAARVDVKLERDAHSGALDEMAALALREDRDGRTRHP